MCVCMYIYLQGGNSGNTVGRGLFHQSETFWRWHGSGLLVLLHIFCSKVSPCNHELFYSVLWKYSFCPICDCSPLYCACRFASFYETATADSMLQYLIAFLVLLATVKLWHLLRLNPKMHMITAALQRAWSDISGFLVIIVIMFIAYSIAVSIFTKTFPIYKD